MSTEAIKYNKYEVELLLKLSKNQEFKLERIFREKMGSWNEL